MGQGALVDRRLPNCSPCAVCGAETNQHARWFLVAENRWLDHLKILSWHPVLAAQKDILSVCGELHLRALVTHWLTKANLELHTGRARVLPITSESQTEDELGPLAVGRLVGELAVHREAISRVWTGSPETLECILNALIGGEAKPRAMDFSLAGLHAEPPAELAFNQGAGRA